MEIHLYALCWNEAEILPFFFQHYDKLVSRYFIFDDGSTDGSLELLRNRENVEVHRFSRSDPTSFVFSEQSLSNEVWKASQGLADWVIVTDIDEHLFHPELGSLLQHYQDIGITVVPALGYQMISEMFPEPGETLCETRVRGAPHPHYAKLSLFDPAAISEIFYAEGRHSADPKGRVIAPATDQILLLHYKYLSCEWARRRDRQKRAGLGPKDHKRRWGYEYWYSDEEYAREWQKILTNAIDIRSDAALVNYPTPRWWDQFRPQLFERASNLTDALSATAALHGEIAGLRKALARAEQEVWERAGLIETMRAELLSSNEALTQPRREAQERLAEIARLESELARLREAMVETEREALQGESAATALRNEIATLREAIGRAEQEGNMRAAEVARLGREIDGLRATVTRAECDAAAMQSALVAARQIGRAAIDALAMGKLAPLDRPPGLGWRQALRRRFALPAARE
jgi:hypothetical protein